MDISYWIFILIVYLISQWVQSRTKNISDENNKLNNEGFSPDEKNDSFQNQNLPQWIKNLDPQGNSFEDLSFNQSDDFNIENISKTEKSVNVIEQNIQDDELSEDIKEDIEEKVLDGIEEVNEEENFNQPILEDLNEKKFNPRKNKSFNIFDILQSKRDIKKAILLNEILSLPRALNKYSIKK
tara:strand:+ start:16272 stop:16820 length:549 start_codon:yes stop_codon:yes gene_type:complete